MKAIAIGAQVRVVGLFATFFPDVYVVEAQSITGAWQIAGGIDFAPEFLEVI